MKCVYYLLKMGGEGVLTRDEIQDIINIANDIAEHTRLGEHMYMLQTILKLPGHFSPKCPDCFKSVGEFWAV